MISSNYNAHEHKLFDRLQSIPINNYLTHYLDLEEDNILTDRQKKPLDRRYCDWGLLDFVLRNNVYIEAWITNDVFMHKNITTRANYYQLMYKTKEKGFFDCLRTQEIHPSNQKRNPFDWMGMNVEIVRQHSIYNEILRQHSISNLELRSFSKFAIFYDMYMSKPWVIPIKLLLLDFNVSTELLAKKKIKKISEIYLLPPFIPLKENESPELKYKLKIESPGERKYNGRADLVLKEQEKKVGKDNKRFEEIDIKTKLKEGRKKRKSKELEQEIIYLVRKSLRFQFKWGGNSLSSEINSDQLLDNTQLYSIMLRAVTPKRILISAVRRRDMSLDIGKNEYLIQDLIKRGQIILEPAILSMSINNDGQFLMYQIVGISLIHMSKNPIYQREVPDYADSYKKSREIYSYADSYKKYQEIPSYDFSILYEKSLSRYEKMTRKRNEYYSSLFLPENILSSRRRRELRTLICFNHRNRKSMHENTIYDSGNRVKRDWQTLSKNENLGGDINKLIKFKLFLWPNYRLEDLACMNRYWFNTNNGIHFSMIRIRMYPQLKN